MLEKGVAALIERTVKLKATESLMPMLSGKVFHVTPTTNMLSISAAGEIRPNLNSEWDSPFGNSETGFFRLRGCVSFFDYRSYGSQDWKAHAYKCSPDQILCRTDSISVLILNDSKYSHLENWKLWKEEEKWSQRVVPVVEAGFPGAVNLEFITEHMLVTVSSS